MSDSSENDDFKLNSESDNILSPVKMNKNSNSTKKKIVSSEDSFSNEDNESTDYDSEFSDDEEFAQPKKTTKSINKKTKTPTKTSTKTSTKPSSKVVSKTTKSSVKTTPTVKISAITSTSKQSDSINTVHKPLTETLKLFSPKVGLSRRVSNSTDGGIPLLNNSIPNLRQGLSKNSKPKEPLHKQN